jgi:hypothetical protein
MGTGLESGRVFALDLLPGDLAPVKPAARHATLRALGFALVALAFASALPCSAQPLPAAASERSVKAAYIYRFLPYVEWPPAALAPGAPIVIGVVGADDVAMELEQLIRNRTGDDRTIAVRRLGPNEAWVGAHVLYAGQEIAARVLTVAKALQDRSVLTISDVDGAVERGFVIGFVNIDSRLRFEVNADVAERSGLKLSSRLLAVASRVRTGAR